VSPPVSMPLRENIVFAFYLLSLSPAAPKNLSLYPAIERLARISAQPTGAGFHGNFLDRR
jgi:hypothetical protein